MSNVISCNLMNNFFLILTCSWWQYPSPGTIAEQGDTKIYGSIMTYIYIGYPVLIVPHGHDDKYELTWSCEILIIFSSSILGSYQSQIELTYNGARWLTHRYRMRALHPTLQKFFSQYWYLVVATKRPKVDKCAIQILLKYFLYSHCYAK